MRREQSLTVASAILLLSALTAKPDSGDGWNSLRQQALVAAHEGLLPKAEMLLRAGLKFLPDQDNVAAVVLWNELGGIHQSNRLLDEAAGDFNRALSINSHLPAADEEQKAIALNNLGTIAGERRNTAEAEKLLREAYEALEEVNHTDNQIAALVRGNLALTFQQEGRNQEARSLYERASADVKRWYGQESIHYARILTNQALLDMEIGFYQAAVTNGELAARIEHRLPYVSQTDRALTSNNLGFALTEMGTYAEAETWLLDAIRIEESMSDGGAQLVSSLNNLAALEEKQGHLKVAGEQELRATKLIEAGTRVDDTLMAAVWNNLGRIAASEHKDGEARELYARALKIWEKDPKRGNAHYAATLSNVAALESAERHYKKSEALYRQALAIDESHLGPSHPEVASDLSNIATQLFYQKQHAEALELYGRARAIMEASLGSSNVQVARTWRNMAVVNYARKDYEGSAYAYGEAVGALSKFSSGEDANLPGWLHEYAGALWKAQRFGEAEAAETRALGMEVRMALAKQKQKDASGKAEAGKT